jgi:spectinomycin phosphotransferase
LLRDRSGTIFVIDWEDVMIAPKERDFIFVKGLEAQCPAPQDRIPFFRGYGEAEIDLKALSYYRHKRVVRI